MGSERDVSLASARRIRSVLPTRLRQDRVDAPRRSGRPELIDLSYRNPSPCNGPERPHLVSTLLGLRLAWYRFNSVVVSSTVAARSRTARLHGIPRRTSSAHLSIVPVAEPVASHFVGGCFGLAEPAQHLHLIACIGLADPAHGKSTRRPGGAQAGQGRPPPLPVAACSCCSGLCSSMVPGVPAILCQ